MDHEVERRIWDVLVIGTGMGGATLGYALARAGWNVVFVEKGRSYLCLLYTSDAADE